MLSPFCPVIRPPHNAFVLFSLPLLVHKLITDAKDLEWRKSSFSVSEKIEWEDEEETMLLESQMRVPPNMFSHGNIIKDAFYNITNHIYFGPGSYSWAITRYPMSKHHIIPI